MFKLDAEKKEAIDYIMKLEASDRNKTQMILALLKDEIEKLIADYNITNAKLLLESALNIKISYRVFNYFVKKHCSKIPNSAPDETAPKKQEEPKKKKSSIFDFKSNIKRFDF